MPCEKKLAPKSNETTPEKKKMPLLTLDPNKPKLTPVSIRSPHKRSTPPQSPPTPHKIELIEECHQQQRKLRSSQSISSDSGSSTASSSSDEILQVPATNGTSNGATIPTAVRTSPRKLTENGQRSLKMTIVLPKKGEDNGLHKVATIAQGPKKKLSFIEEDDKKSKTSSVKAFMPIRRSERRPKKNQTADIVQRLQDIANDDTNLPLKVVDIPGKNRGVVPTKKLSKGDFVVEYAGELIEHSTAEERENKYAMDISKGCYMYYFKTNGKHYCIDATVETGRFGRLVNHSRLHPNCITKVIMVGKSPRLVLLAKNDIESGTELLYDYGDRSKESLAAHPWLAK